MTLGMLTSCRDDAAASVHGKPPVRVNGRRGLAGPLRGSERRRAEIDDQRERAAIGGLSATAGAVLRARRR
jgi:hypothetical protein